MTTTPHCPWPRAPRAGLQPVTTAGAALSIVNRAARRPPTAETIVIVLDDGRWGRSLVSVEGTEDDDAILTVVDFVAAAAAANDELDALVVASVRPGRPSTPADVDRWLEASDLCEMRGRELVEWFVLSGDGPPHGVSCPRDLLGEPPRW